MSMNTADRAIEALSELIKSEEFVPGARLPTERDLSERLQVNRATIRKALARLEYEGRITRHVGRGTFVAEVATLPQDIAAASSPIELMDARLLIEPVVAREAALRARTPDLEQMQKLLDRFERADDFGEFEKWDIQFHRAVARATQNSIFASIDEMLRNLRSTPEWDKFKRGSFSSATRELYRREHRLILAALSERDAIAAGKAMEMHIRSIHTRLTRFG